MKEDIHKHLSVTQTEFFHKNQQKKAGHIIPLFMQTSNFQSLHKSFSLYQLQRSCLNSNLKFKGLVLQLSKFNKHLIRAQQIQRKKISQKVYHLYRNLHEQLSNLNALSSTNQQAESLLYQISKWFENEKQKVSQVKQKNKQLPEINLKKQEANPQEQERLYRTITDMRNKRQSERYKIMTKSSYAEYFSSKDKILDYRKQEEQKFMSENTSFAFNEKSLPKSDFLQNSFYNESKSAFNLASTRYTTANNFTNQKYHNDQSNSNEKARKLSSSSNILAKSPTRKLSINQTKLTKHNNCQQSVIQSKRSQSFLLIEDLIKKDKIQRIINKPDHSKIKRQLFNQNKGNEEYFQAHQIKSSKISFILNPKKTQLTNRKQFINVQSQLLKKKLFTSRLKTDTKRKFQFRQYLSNYVQQKNTSINQMGKNFALLACKVETKLKNSHLQSKRDVALLVPSEQRRKQFQTNLLKKKNKQTSIHYMKYLNHISSRQKDQENDKYRSTNSSTFSKNSSTLKLSSSQSVSNRPTQRFRSLTSFRSQSLQKKFNSVQRFSIMSTLEKQTVEKVNIEAINEAMKAKLKISEIRTVDNNKNFVSKNSIYKGLSLHQNPQKIQFLPLQSKLLSNPFFKVKKTKKTKKKKNK